MSRLSVSERMRVASLAADKSRRAVLSRLLYSPILRWRYGAPVADQLLIVPQDLRTADPSFWHEVVLDHFGLAGTVAALDGNSPFDVRAPNLAWAHALHGFGWLRHLGASGHDEAKAMACRLAVDWVGRSNRSDTAFTWLPQVAARRAISWISHSNVLLDGANQKTYDVIANSLGAQLVRLSAEWRDTPGGYPRLLVLTALVLADLAIAGHDRRLAEAEKMFAAELQRQILPDGGHISRNPRILVELMLDLLPLRQCFAARGRPLPAGMLAAMQRMLTMLRYLRLGDGRLVRFNGTGVAASAGLATVLAYDDRPSTALTEARNSNYQRLERGDTIVIVDAGAPPPLEFAGEAYAGCLSFEMSVDTELLLVNGGAPAPVDAGWRAAARATASHNTLCLADTSSARLVRHRRLEALIGSAPIREPDNVEYKTKERDGAIVFGGQHDGYVKKFGLKHSRRISLAASGTRVEGSDRLKDPFGTLRLNHDLPFAIHFHVHPDVLCQRTDEPNVAEMILRSGEVWTFTLRGATLALEEGTFFADSTGPTRALQLIARGATSGDTQVDWVIEKYVEPAEEDVVPVAPDAPAAETVEVQGAPAVLEQGKQDTKSETSEVDANGDELPPTPTPTPAAEDAQDAKAPPTVAGSEEKIGPEGDAEPEAKAEPKATPESDNPTDATTAATAAKSDDGNATAEPGKTEPDTSPNDTKDNT